MRRSALGALRKFIPKNSSVTPKLRASPDHSVWVLCFEPYEREKERKERLWAQPNLLYSLLFRVILPGADQSVGSSGKVVLSARVVSFSEIPANEFSDV